MIKLLVVNSAREKAIPFYRSTLPFLKLRDELPELVPTIIHHEDFSNFFWDNIEQYDAVFLSNPITFRHVDIIRGFKQFNKKVWVDFDDDYLRLHEIKNSIPSKVAQITKAAEHGIKCIELATEITVSVAYLKDVINQFTDKPVSVVPNAFPIEYLNDILLYMPTGSNRHFGIHDFITWRGKNNLHNKNLKAFREQITNIGIKHPEWKFMFFGNEIEDEFFPDGFNYEHYHPTQDITSNSLRMQEKFAKIHIVPMTDIPFNHSKSMISWMEGTINGSAVLAPDWIEWQRPGVINYRTKQEFESLLNEMIEGKHDLQACFKQSFDYIVNNLSLKIVNKERVKILIRLLTH